MYQSLSKRKILSVCIAASLLSHVISLIFLQNHTFWAASTPASPVAVSCLASMDKVESDKVLRESFQESCVEESKKICSQDPRPEVFRAPLMPLFLPIEPLPTPAPSSALKHEPVDWRSASFQGGIPQFAAEIPKPSFSLPPIESLNIFEHLPKDLILPTPFMARTLERTPSLLPKAPIASVSTPIPKRAAAAPVHYVTTLRPLLCKRIRSIFLYAESPDPLSASRVS